MATPTLDQNRGAVIRPGPGSTVWRVQRERIMLLAWGRAILLQFAHPLVAAGVAHHSSFSDDPGANRARLHRTVSAMLDLTFGTPEHAARAAARINGIHDRVNGVLEEATGAYGADSPYSAHMPDLLLWVYTTLVESSLLVYQQFVRPLTCDEQDSYCAESRAIGPWLGIPVASMPEDRAALDRYMTAMIVGGHIALGPTGRRLGRQLVSSRPAWPVRGPLLRALHWPSVGLLPPTLREAYGFSWRRSDQIGLDVASAASRRLLPLLPRVTREWSVAYRAERSHNWRVNCRHG